MYRILTLIILIFIIPIYLTAESQNSSEFSGYPQFSYSTETGFVGGGIIYYKYRPDYNPEKVPKNSLTFTARYSQKKQFYSELEKEIYFGKGDYLLDLRASYKNWPSTFYGIGIKSREKDAEDYTPEFAELSLDLKRISGNINYVVRFDVEHSEILESEEDGVLSTSEINGAEEHWLSGTGLALEWDTRDQESFPGKGEYITFTGLVFSHFIGSDYDFQDISLNIRKYFTLGKTQWLALQFYSGKIFGDLPFGRLYKLDDYLRGYPVDLYRDVNIASARIEYRSFPFNRSFFNKIGFVVFTEIGQVAGYLGEYSLNNIKPAGGAGIRYSLFTEERFNLRFDVGFGKDSINISIGGGESF